MKYKFKSLFYKVVNKNDFLFIKNFLDKNGFCFNFEQTNYPHYLVIHLNDKSIQYYDIPRVSIEFKDIDAIRYINESNKTFSFSNTEPILYNRKDIHIIECIFKYGYKAPSYKPRRKLT